MNILVTGSAGFLGAELVKLLKKFSHFVIGVDTRKESLSDIFVLHDLRLRNSPSVPHFDCCIHLASSVGGFLFNAEQYTLPENELAIFEGVHALCSQHRCERLIYTSTINVFERSATYPHESLESIECQTPYALAKALTEKEIESKFSSFAIVRPTNLFGPTQTTSGICAGSSHVIPELIEKLSSPGRYLQVLGDGAQIRNFLHVSDAAQCIVRLLERPKRCWLNVRSEIHISIAELAQTLLQISGCSKEIQFNDQFTRYEPVSIQRFPIDSLKYFGWEPMVSSIQDGLRGLSDSFCFQAASNDD